MGPGDREQLGELLEPMVDAFLLDLDRQRAVRLSSAEGASTQGTDGGERPAPRGGAGYPGAPPEKADLPRGTRRY